MESFSTLKVASQRGVLTLTMDRPAANNSIDPVMLHELSHAFQMVATDPATKVTVLAGSATHFCTGMDFEAARQGMGNPTTDDNPKAYYALLKQIATCPQVVVAKVDGLANAGGIGFVAASDLVIASHKAAFGLSEALFGLLPACVMPFLIKRVGSQKAQWMTLTTQAITAQRAYEIGLVDEVGDNTADMLRKAMLRLTKLDTETIKTLKDYMAKLWIINQETERLAVETITALTQSEKVQHNIKNYVEKGIFPWNK